MQSTTSTNTTTIFRTRSPPTQSSPQPVMEGLDKLERLAVARLQHHVNELQLQVDNDLSLKPPVRKTLQCVCDETALTASIPDLKRFIAERSITMLVPLSGKFSFAFESFPAPCLTITPQRWTPSTSSRKELMKLTSTPARPSATSTALKRPVWAVAQSQA